jgi:uncharacterized protein with NAD-binding domain and iron-sulfur cluster
MPVTRVAIVGGGFAGIAAAWSLSQQKDFQVDIYEKSWRLGGKTASARAQGDYIVDNSLGVWLGFYENAFRMIRQCYAEVERCKWGPDANAGDVLLFGRMEDAFFPEPNVGAWGRNPKTSAGTGDSSPDWAVWSAYFPPANGLPGEPMDEDSNPFTLKNYLFRSFELLKTLTLSVIRAPDEDPRGEPRPDDRSVSDQILNFNYSVDGAASLQLMIERATKLLRAGSLTGAALWLQAVTILEVWLQDFNFGLQSADSALSLVEAVAAQTRKLLRDFVAIDPEIRFRTEIIDLVLTIAVGLFRDRVLFDDSGLDSINDSDFRDWLLQHGATKESVNSRFLTAVYDLTFAYGNGAKAKPTLAAGVALRGLLRAFFTYRGSMFWRLRSGTGEAVFAPLYRVLRSGQTSPDGQKLPAVRFHFLHELEGVEFEELKGKRYVKSLTFTVGGPRDAVDTKSDDALDEFGFWPDTPRRFPVEKRGDYSHTLVEFDAVILAIGADDFKHACLNSAQELPPEWKAMADTVRTIATKSAQVWLDPTLESLNWHRGSGLVTALGLSFHTWVDMTPSLATEAWLAQHQKRKAPDTGSLAFFCGPLELSDLEQQADSALGAFRDDIHHQWTSLPKKNRGAQSRTAAATGHAARAIGRTMADEPWAGLRGHNPPGELVGYAKALLSASSSEQAKAKATAKSWLVEYAAGPAVNKDLHQLLGRQIRAVWPAGVGGSQQDVLKRQTKANVKGSDRYALSEPGLIVHRVSPLDPSVANLTIAGDWTACGLDVGCVESAVISGLLASHAISGKPELDEIIGYNHP